MRSKKKFLLISLIAGFALFSSYLIISSRLLPVSEEFGQSWNGDDGKKVPHETKNPYDRYYGTRFGQDPLTSAHQIRRREDRDNSSRLGDHEHLLNSIKIGRGETFEFNDCRMSNCFDFSRCQNEGPIKVGIIPRKTRSNNKANPNLGESNQIHEKILKIIRESSHYESDLEQACVFVLEDDTLDRDPLSQSFQSDLTDIFDYKSNYGMNHLIFNLYSGSWPDYRDNNFAGLNFGAAILVKASNSIAHHRSGFDISLPLFSVLHPLSDSNLTDQNGPMVDNRTYLLTFKGKRYVYGSGSTTRNRLYHLNNQRDIVMLTTCRHGKKWRDSSDDRCLKDELNYDKYDFVDLMKDSKFCLTPRGRRLGSFRYLEAMSFGCIPVILSDGWVKPFDDIIDWSCAALQFDEDSLLQVTDMLRDISDDTIDRMKKNCMSLYQRYFSTIERIILTTLSIVEKRIKNELARR